MKRLILASTSPCRKEILSKTGLKFEIIASDYEEDMSLNLKPLELAKFLSKGKAQAVANKHKNAVIIGADTFVALDDELLGKPHTQTEAKKMLKKISGKTVSVITGYAIIDTKLGKTISKATEAKVFIKKLTEKEIDAYIQTKEPLDKAGAFAIQERGAFMIEKIEGDFFNIMGLPLYDIIHDLEKLDIRIF